MAPRKRNLTRKKVAEAALALIEREGLEHLSMRRLGGELGVEGMALYTHVRNKQDLLDAVGDLVLQELEVRSAREEPWQVRLRRGALAWGRLQQRYPRAFPLIFRGGLQTDKVRRLTEELLDALRVAGFDERGAAEAYQAFVIPLDAALVAKSSWSDTEMQAAWSRGAEGAAATAYPRYAEVAPHAAKLGWPPIFDAAVDLLVRGLEERVRCFGHDAGADDRG